MEARFKVIVGNDKGKSFVLGPGRSMTIGRSSASDIELSEPRISRIHCQLTNNGSRVILTDLRSTNGTFLNEKRVKSAPLQASDKVRIGSTIIAIELGGADEESKREAAVERPKERKPLQGMTPARARRAKAVGTADRFAETDGEAAKRGKGAADLPELGQTIAGCRLVAKIKESGKEISFRAVQLSIDRTIMLKLLSNSGTASAEEIERFLGPARSAGKLSHPNIAQIHETGSDRGIYYIIQELVEGKTVKELTTKSGRGEPLSVALAVDIASQVAMALEYAHDQKVMHGDLRPEKVIICAAGAGTHADIRSVHSLGIVKVVEFGPGGYLLGGESDAKRAILGPTSIHNYRAPEQIQKKKRVDHRADIYSLGAVFFRMLTGRPPFVSGKPEELINAILETDIESPKNFNPSIPQAVCRIVEMAMAKDPDDRYQGMDEMLEEFKKLTELA